VTCSRVMRARNRVGMAEASPNGSSKCSAKTGRMAADFGCDRLLVVFGLEAGGNGAGVAGLVKLGDVESDREGLDGRGAFAHVSGNGGGVHAAAEKCAKWHLAHQTAAHRVAARGCPEPRWIRPQVLLRAGLEVELPVAARGRASIRAHGERAARGQFLNALDNRIRLGNVTESKEAGHAFGMNAAREPIDFEQRFQFAGEREGKLRRGGPCNRWASCRIGHGPGRVPGRGHPRWRRRTSR
jgi:hypothetical protein